MASGPFQAHATANWLGGGSMGRTHQVCMCLPLLCLQVGEHEHFALKVKGCVIAHGKQLQHRLEILGIRLQYVFLNAVVENELDSEPALFTSLLLCPGRLDICHLPHLIVALQLLRLPVFLICHVGLHLTEGMANAVSPAR
jgi:hypothetical protein